MQLNADEWRDLCVAYGASENDTGDVKVQVALLTKKISHLTKHLKVHKKDYSTQTTLMKYVGKRRRHLRYLQRKNVGAYRTLIKALGLRH